MSQTKDIDLLVLGATGYTGRLITRYLAAHPQRHAFSLGIAGRSQSKLLKLADELSLPKSVVVVKVDVEDKDEVERAVKTTRVMINAVGPYWKWGTAVVRSCVRNGVHYVDPTGESVWIKEIINKFDYYATKTGAIIVNSCGLDSILSDITAFLSVKTLKSLSDTGMSTTNVGSAAIHHNALNPGLSVTAYKLFGVISGGAVNTIMNSIEEVPGKKRSGLRDYCLSPVNGYSAPRFQAWYHLPILGARPIIGAFFFMQPTNRKLVQRTFGLLELQALSEKPTSDNRDTAGMSASQKERYGPDFVYDEFIVMPNCLVAAAFTVAFLVGIISFMLIKPLRWMVKWLMPPGPGFSDNQLKRGYLVSTNYTTSTSQPPVQVKTVFKGNGDPAYLLTSIMISESALCFLLPPISAARNLSLQQDYDPIQALPSLARKGGVLTPMTAFGDVLVQRLEETGRFEISSSVLGDEKGRKDL